MTQISNAIIEFNPWWKESFNVNFKDRDIYHKIQKYVKLRQILAFTGLRRVGKTTLMLKMVQDAIQKGIDPKHILYFSFDEFRKVELRVLLEEYEELVGSMPEFLFLDEIQKVPDWENQIKTIYDLQKIKIVVSGSESLFIKKKSKETLAGRLFEFTVHPLTFREFLNFKNIEYKPIDLHKKELSRLFKKYIITLGFPELIDISDKEIIQKYINESIVEKVIYRDLQIMGLVKDISVVMSLLNIFLQKPGQLTDLSTLARQLDLSRQTISTYLSYLEDSFLLRKLYNFSRSRRKVERKLKKYYPTVLSPDLIFKEDKESQSLVFEWVLVNQLRAEFFWRDSYKNEVDIIIADKSPIPIEVKYGKIETQGLRLFMKKFNVRKGYIVSSKIEEKRKLGDKEIYMIPAFKFLLTEQ